MRNNADFGITVQNFICQKYNVKIPDEAVNQFKSNFSPEYVDEIDDTIEKIFKCLGKQPKECTTYVRSQNKNETLTPHNFILSDGTTLSIRTNKNKDKVAPRVVGQCGIDVFNAFFSDIAGFSVTDKNQIKEIIQLNIDKMLPIFLDYLFVSDYTVWLHKDSEDRISFEIFDRNQYVNIDFERERFSFTKENSEWNESTTLKYNGISIAEIQIHKNRTFKFRFIMKSLQKFLCEAKQTNETFGITAEKAICDLFKLSYPINFNKRYSKKIQTDITSTLIKAFKVLPVPIKYTGAEKGERGEQSKCSYDFVLKGNKSLSLKTNTGKMICPPEVGQPGAETCYIYFGHLTEENHIDGTIFKRMVFAHISEMMPIYLSHLLDSDYMLWIYRRKNNYEYKIYDSTFAHDIKWHIEKFSFTRSTITDWNESNTVKYNGISLGEFQVHKARSCFKFRFNMENLEKILEQNHE